MRFWLKLKLPSGKPLLYTSLRPPGGLRTTLVLNSPRHPDDGRYGL